jgi:SET domain-containing protein
MEATTSPYILVRKSKIHGTGVYAAKDIPQGEMIIEYVGRKISKKESLALYEKQLQKHKKNCGIGSVYTFELNKTWDLDGDVPENTARYINHSCSPNAEAVSTGRKIIIQALCDIKKGEEISYNYGYNIDDYEEHLCKCGSANCIGFIAGEEYWEELREKMKGKKK